MLSGDEVRKSASQIQFSLAALSVAGLQLPAASDMKESTFRIRTVATARSVDLSGSQVLLGSVSALGMGLFVWALVKLANFPDKRSPDYETRIGHGAKASRGELRSELSGQCPRG